MNITITINTDNDIFQPDPVYETQRLLRRLAACIGEKGLEERKLIDTNGNSIGEMKIKDSDGGA